MSRVRDCYWVGAGPNPNYPTNIEPKVVLRLMVFIVKGELRISLGSRRNPISPAGNGP